MRSSSILTKVYPSTEEMRAAICKGFSYFEREIPSFEKRKYGVSENQVPYVQGAMESEWAWILIFEWPGELDGDYKYVCDVQSRGDDNFAAIICYSLCKAFGERIEDDAGYLEAGREFTLDEFEASLKGKLGVSF